VTHHSRLIRVGHSPDPDDAFMFYALAAGRIDTGAYRFEHELADIETLNRRAERAELELTALSVHAYAYLADKYVLCRCGASVGDGYGPILVAREPLAWEQLPGKRFAVPGRRTTAWLALRLLLGCEFADVVVPFDEILSATVAGVYQSQPVDVGLVIHEGQLTFADAGLVRVADLGRRWQALTGLPLPLGVNALRRDLGLQTLREVHRLLRESIAYGLQHRQEAIEYAMQFGRGLDRSRTDRFVGMYVNQWTEDLGQRGRRAVGELLARAYQAEVIPGPVRPEFVPE